MFLRDNHDMKALPMKRATKDILRWILPGLMALLAACSRSSSVDAPAPGSRASGPECSAPAEGEPMLITEDCVDPRYKEPYLLGDLGELKVELLPVPHYIVRGGFRGTPAVFAFYFPLPPQYQGRFFQGPIHQLRLTGEIASDTELRFAFDSGAYVVQTNPLQDGALTARDALKGTIDPALMGYRLAAASAKYSRVIAARLYGDARRPYGYLSGGSGGAYMTLSAAEHTDGVWDGFVPFVSAHPLAIPSDFTVRLHALRVLRQRNKWPEVVDAIDPGGSGDPYAKLNEEEASALGEATRLGFPPRGWFAHASMTGGPFFLVAQYAPILDPSYVGDFWSKPGYLGTDPASSVVAARVQHPASVVAATAPAPAPDYASLGPAYNAWITGQYAAGPARQITLSSLPEGDLTNDFHLVIESGAAMGKTVKIGSVDRNTNTIGFGGGEDPAVVNLIAVGDQLRVDNSLFLALQTFHRHQVPASRELYGWEQFRDAGGAPIYPQRAVQVGPIGAYRASGSVASGRFHGKMIMLGSLMDVDAFPWCSDWYRLQAQKAAQAQGRPLEDSYRLWFTDHAQHNIENSDPTRTVNYQGVQQQALRDVSKWVEQGVPPPASTNYTVVDTQILVPPTAAERRGIQPVVTLKANGGERAEVAVNEPVAFTATVELPPGSGTLVETEWDYEGTGTPIPNPVPGLTPDPGTGSVGGVNLPPNTVTLEGSHSYAQPGTYFALLKATSQREGDADTPHARVQNIARVRVVVR